jgi:ribosomal protein S18 acetylase RimI-like enzyme
MQEIEIRLARDGEHIAVGACVDAAYARYIERIGKKPAPMLADYAALIARGVVYVVPDENALRAVAVLILHDDHLFLENIAVHPACQGRGVGRVLMDFVEEQARAAERDEIRLYTHERMTENLPFYRGLGYEEVERRTEDGYARVFMRKVLRRCAFPPSTLRAIQRIQRSRRDHTTHGKDGCRAETRGDRRTEQLGPVGR